MSSTPANEVHNQTTATRTGAEIKTDRSPGNANPTTEQATRVAHDTIDSLAKSAAGAERKMRDLGAKAEQQLREKQEVASKQADAVMQQVQSYAREKPLAAAGIAFAAGLLMSRLISR